MAEPSRPPPLRAPLGTIAERLYRFVLKHRNTEFDSGKRVLRLTVPVISVGNLSVGGTGKTPTVMRLVQWLLDAERRPAIAMRGYRARPGAPSDEEAEYRDRFPTVPVVAQPNRAAGLAPLIERREIDCIVLDDGFQHRQIARDLDIVLLDATRPFDTDRCLPAGWLREPPASLDRAGAVVLTRVDQASDESLNRQRLAVESLTRRALVAECAHAWDSLRIGPRDEPVESLSGRSVVVACAIGNPDAFIAAAERAGARVVARIARRDHHDWNDWDLADLRRLLPEGSLILTTAKDFVKLRRLDLGALADRLAVPRLSIRFTRGEPALRDAVLRAASPAAGVH